jgi:hypothetical protein
MPLSSFAGSMQLPETIGADRVIWNPIEAGSTPDHDGYDQFGCSTGQMREERAPTVRGRAFHKGFMVETMS